MGKRFIAAVAAVAVLAAVVWETRPQPEIPPVTESLNINAEAVENWNNVIAYVPLDDRTDNMEDVVYLAEASGYRVVMPEGDMYCTKLDGQGNNTHGTPYGDRAALMEWVREMDEKGCDLFLLSLDQLFSGGLVNSRAMSRGEDLVFSDGTVLSEADAFDAYILPLADDPANRIYMFDSVVRLASTVAYQGFGEAEYYALREYGMVARPALEGEELTLENVFANYPYAADGVTPAEDALGEMKYRDTLTEQMLEDYLGARVRKLTLTDHVIDAIHGCENQNIQLLIGIDDSSNTENIQYNELHYLEQQLGQGSTLLTGLDSLARLLVGRMAQETYDYRVKASVRYVGGSEGIPSSEFDRYTLEEVVDLHMDLFRAIRVPEAEAELQIVVMTAPHKWGIADACCEELVSLLEYNIANRIPTVFIEASNNAYGEQLEQMLRERVDFAGLVAYAGKYDQANVTGASFAMGFSRYLYLRCCEEKNPWADVSQIKQIANSMVLTSYILNTRYDLNVYIRDMGHNYQNILANSREMRLILERLAALFEKDCEWVENNLLGTELMTDLSPLGTMAVTEVNIRDVYFPWNRTFEISFSIDAQGLQTQ